MVLAAHCNASLIIVTLQVSEVDYIGGVFIGVGNVILVGHAVRVGVSPIYAGIRSRCACPAASAGSVVI